MVSERGHNIWGVEEIARSQQRKNSPEKISVSSQELKDKLEDVIEKMYYFPFPKPGHQTLYADFSILCATSYKIRYLPKMPSQGDSVEGSDMDAMKNQPQEREKICLDPIYQIME